MKALPVLIFLTWLLSSGNPTKVVSAGSGRSLRVALTFDAGSDRGFAGSILQTLERAHVRASFGMTGRWARENPDLVRRMSRDGDVFLNHTFDHRSFTGLSTHSLPLSDSQRRWEILSTEHEIRQLTGHSARPYFRPPYGDYDSGTLALLHHLGYQYMVMWTVDSLGWDHLTANQILIRCETTARPGVIYLMHVGSQSQDAQALPALIQNLKRRHYRFATIPSLVS